VAIFGCLLHTGVLSAPITASAVASDYVPSALEQQNAEEIRELLHKAQLIMQDPAKMKLLSQRIQQVFKDPEFKAQMKAQMEALRNDEAFYTWLKMMLTPSAVFRPPRSPRRRCRRCCGLCVLAPGRQPAWFLRPAGVLLRRRDGGEDPLLP